jgi:hypothetical protein
MIQGPLGGLSRKKLTRFPHAEAIRKEPAGVEYPALLLDFHLRISNPASSLFRALVGGASTPIRGEPDFHPIQPASMGRRTVDV